MMARWEKADKLRLQGKSSSSVANIVKIKTLNVYTTKGCCLECCLILVSCN